MKQLKFILDKKANEPQPDIAGCSECGWHGSVSECEIDEEGDWENGYYKIHLCPKCEDGGCIEDYEMSSKRYKEWKDFINEKNKTNHE